MIKHNGVKVGGGGGQNPTRGNSNVERVAKKGGQKENCRSLEK